MEFRGPRNRQINREPQHKINELIKAPTVRVVGENIEPGVYPLPIWSKFLLMQNRLYAVLSNTVSFCIS